MKNKREKLINVLIAILYGLTVGLGMIFLFISFYFRIDFIILSFILLSLAVPIVIFTINYSESPLKSRILEFKKGKMWWISLNMVILSIVPLLWGGYLYIVDKDTYLIIFFILALPTLLFMIINMISYVKARQQLDIEQDK